MLGLSVGWCDTPLKLTLSSNFINCSIHIKSTTREIHVQHHSMFLEVSVPVRTSSRDEESATANSKSGLAAVLPRVQPTQIALHSLTHQHTQLGGAGLGLSFALSSICGCWTPALWLSLAQLFPSPCSLSSLGLSICVLVFVFFSFSAEILERL